MERINPSMPRRSFAFFAKSNPAAQQLGQHKKSALIAALLVQLALLASLAIVRFRTEPLHYSDVGVLIGLLALLTAIYVIYMIATHDVRGPGEREPGYGVSGRDAEQLARLKAQVGHELRTPLNALIGFSEMMHREMLGPVGNERYREYAAHIHKSAERVKRATERTLAVTDLLASPTPRALRRINLTGLVAGSLATYRETVGTSEPHWIISIDEAVSIHGDAVALQAAFRNLWWCGRVLAKRSRIDGGAATCAVNCVHRPGVSHVELVFTVAGCEAVQLGGDAEQAPGLELSWLLARLEVEASGGTVAINSHIEGGWRATLRLPV